MDILLYCFAAIGAVCTLFEVGSWLFRRRMRFTCLLFGDRAREQFDQKTYDIIVLCRSAEQEQELIRRLSANEKRKIYIRRW